MSYTKLFHRIITSSIWDEPNSTRIVWITMLAMANQDGYVGSTVKSLALLSRTTEEECRTALGVFQKPDGESRSKEHDGRRVEQVEGGWMILNHEKYRNSISDDPVTAKTRERVRRFREAKKAETVVPGSSGEVPFTGDEDLGKRCGKYAAVVKRVLEARPEFKKMVAEDIAQEIIKADQQGLDWGVKLVEFCKDLANSIESPKNPLALLRAYLNNTKKAASGGFKTTL